MKAQEYYHEISLGQKIEAVHQFMEDIKRYRRTGKSNFFTNFGLCSNLSEYLDMHSAGGKVVEQYGVGWPHHTGNVCYPVPDPFEERGCDEIYDKMKNKYDGEYGVLRISLLSHIMGRLVEERDNG